MFYVSFFVVGHIQCSFSEMSGMTCLLTLQTNQHMYLVNTIEEAMTC